MSGLLLLPHVEVVDHVLVAQVEVAARDDRVRPGRQRVLRDGEAALLFVAFGRRLDEAQPWVDGQLTGGRVLYDLYGGSGNLSLAPAARSPVLRDSV